MANNCYGDCGRYGALNSLYRAWQVPCAGGTNPSWGGCGCNGCNGCGGCGGNGGQTNTGCGCGPAAAQYAVVQPVNAAAGGGLLIIVLIADALLRLLRPGLLGAARGTTRGTASTAIGIGTGTPCCPGGQGFPGLIGLLIAVIVIAVVITVVAVLILIRITILVAILIIAVAVVIIAILVIVAVIAIIVGIVIGTVVVSVVVGITAVVCAAAGLTAAANGTKYLSFVHIPGTTAPARIGIASICHRKLLMILIVPAF